MNGIFKIFVCFFLLYFCAASLCLSADTEQQSKSTEVKATSEQKKEVVKSESIGNKDAVKSESENKEVAPVSIEKNADSAKSAAVFFPEPSFVFDSAIDGSEVLHDFLVINKGTDLLKIEKVKTG